MSAKRPKVPEDLRGMFWRVRWPGDKMIFDETRRGPAACVAFYEPNKAEGAKLYRVTVWRVRK